MQILFLMVIVSVSLATIFLVIFIVSMRNGQFDDTHAPAVRILLDDKPVKKKNNKENKKEEIDNGTAEV